MERSRHRLTTELTVVETERLQAYADGETCVSLASRHKMSVQVLKNQRQVILHKLGADNFAQAVAMAFRRGIIR
jgi:DNA-binding CsgD family transcriptional regulator